jgi:programmed cell death protein 4
VWGPGDGRPVSELKDIMDQLLKVSLVLCSVPANYPAYLIGQTLH